MQTVVLGIVGLGVMGRNIAFNMEKHGFQVSVYDSWAEPVEKMQNITGDRQITCYTDLTAFMKSLTAPRKILMMVQAGKVVDATIHSLLPYLSKGDLLIDGGNSFYKDTIIRSGELDKKGIQFLGIGVSGGEKGALNGPAIMPVGSREAYKNYAPVLEAIAAKIDGQPCCMYIGPEGTGHFVKMIHNGIEYAAMQLICEAYSILRDAAGLSNEEIGQIFQKWNEGELNSYLIEITSSILYQRDTKTGQPMVDVILDKADQKGTGKWTSQVALDLGVSIPTITESVFTRCISNLKLQRQAASKIFKTSVHKTPDVSKDFIESVRKSLYAGTICAFAQGFSLMKTASDANAWDFRCDDIASIFRGGCIIRAQLLNKIMDAYRKNRELPNLMMDSYFSQILIEYQADWRNVVTTALQLEIPIPATASAISYFDAYKSENMSTNLLQAQRDYFGAHTFARTDMDGTFHCNWEK